MSKIARSAGSRPDKLLCGLRNIHFAKWNGSGYETPVRIWNAKSIECGINYETEQEWADDMLIDNASLFAGGEGKLSVLGLSMEEFVAMFGSKKVKGGVVVSSGDQAPQGAFLFERRRKKSKKSRLYVVYNCQCSPGSITAESISEGKGQAQEDEITFTIGETEENNIYYFIDTDAEDVVSDQVENWFKTVQKPVDLETLSVKVKEESEVAVSKEEDENEKEMKVKK